MPHDSARQQTLHEHKNLVVQLTNDPDDILKALRLRYKVFAEGMGAQLPTADQGIDKDRFDELCYHLIVKDTESEQVVGYSRVLTNELAEQAGCYYSETEFDLSQVMKPDYRYMEIGRTCVDPDYRSGAVIAILWTGLANFMSMYEMDYLMGCASIPLAEGYEQTTAIINYLRENHYTPEDTRATPKVAVPEASAEGIDGRQFVPSLLKAYLRVGVKVCGEPCLDADFNVCDVLILLSKDDLNERFLKRVTRS